MAKWSGLEINLFAAGDGNHELSPKFEGWVVDLLKNGFNKIRIEQSFYGDTTHVSIAKSAILIAISKGAQVIWGVTGGVSPWADYRVGVLSAAQWSQDNGVYEFQLGNEEEYYSTGNELTVAEVITNIKSLATEVRAIFTRGNVSYTCFHENISDWIGAGKGDIDILATNVYMTYGADQPLNWKTEIDTIFAAFGADGTYLTEFSLNTNAISDCATSDSVQSSKIKEMLDYIIASGITRASYFMFYDDATPYGPADFGVRKKDGSYRKLWYTLLGQRVPVTRTKVSRTRVSRTKVSRTSI